MFWCLSKGKGKHQPHISNLSHRHNKPLLPSELAFLLDRARRKGKSGRRSRWMGLHSTGSKSFLAELLKLSRDKFWFLVHSAQSQAYWWEWFTLIWQHHRCTERWENCLEGYQIGKQQTSMEEKTPQNSREDNIFQSGQKKRRDFFLFSFLFFFFFSFCPCGKYAHH